MVCGICKKKFEKKHFNQRYCGEECKWRAKRASQEKYKKSDRGQSSNDKWIRSNRRKQNEQGYRQKPRAKEILRKAAKKYRDTHPEYVKLQRETQKKSKWWLAPRARERSKTNSKKYSLTKKGIQARKNGKARRRQREGTGKITAEEWRNKLEEFNNSCARCRATENIEQDHIIPLSKGGSHSIKNIQPLCRSCNAKKGGKLES